MTDADKTEKTDTFSAWWVQLEPLVRIFACDDELNLALQHVIEPKALASHRSR